MENTLKNIATERKNRYNAIAADYLASTKQFTPAYEVEYIEFDEFDDIEYSLVKLIDDQQRAEVEGIIAECEKDDIPMWEYCDAEGIPEFLKGGGDYYGYPNKVLLDTPYIRIKVKVAVFLGGLDSAPSVHDGCIYLTIEEYTSLLSWQMRNRHANYGDLHHDEPELFSIINGYVRNFWVDKVGGMPVSPISTPIYAVDLVEVKEDAMKAIGEPDAGKEIYGNYTSEFSEFVSVSITERKLDMLYNSCEMGSTPSKCEMRKVENVDAIALQKVLGVENYAGIIDHLSENYAVKNGVELFREFLDEHHIEYKFTDSSYTI